MERPCRNELTRVSAVLSCNAHMSKAEEGHQVLRNSTHSLSDMLTDEDSCFAGVIDECLCCFFSGLGILFVRAASAQPGSDFWGAASMAAHETAKVATSSGKAARHWTRCPCWFQFVECAVALARAHFREEGLTLWPLLVRPGNQQSASSPHCRALETCGQRGDPVQVAILNCRVSASSRHPGLFPTGRAVSGSPAAQARI